MMDIGEQVKLTFHGVDILNVHFSAKVAQRGKDLSVNINCVPRVFYPEDNERLFKIVMKVELEDEERFTLSLDAIGNFEINDDLTPELKAKFVNSNAPAIMFPYVRSFISTLTSNMGNTIETLVIPTYFFNGDIEEIQD